VEVGCAGVEASAFTQRLAKPREALRVAYARSCWKVSAFLAAHIDCTAADQKSAQAYFKKKHLPRLLLRI
jgi:hypothetical protein